MNMQKRTDNQDKPFVQRQWLDLPYASLSQAQKLDIYLPDEGAGPFPVIYHIHGGAFAFGDKGDRQVTPFLRGLQRGYAVVSVNYRLSGEAVFPAAVQDLKAGIRWIRANGERYHLDGSRIAACGGSAGGYFSAMLCLTAGVAELEDLTLGNPDTPCHVQAAVDWFGPTDFLKMDPQFAESGLGPCDHNAVDSPESSYLGQKITEIPHQVEQANPMTYIQVTVPPVAGVEAVPPVAGVEAVPPILIQHGRKDHRVPVQQSLIFAEKLQQSVPTDRFALDILENADHGDKLFETDENMARVFAFLDTHLKPFSG